MIYLFVQINRRGVQSMDSSQSDWKSTIAHWEQNVVQAIDSLLLFLACPGGVGVVRNQYKAFVFGGFNLVDYF